MTIKRTRLASHGRCYMYAAHNMQHPGISDGSRTRRLIDWLAKQKQKGSVRYIAERREKVGAWKKERINRERELAGKQEMVGEGKKERTRARNLSKMRISSSFGCVVTWQLVLSHIAFRYIPSSPRLVA